MESWLAISDELDARSLPGKNLVLMRYAAAIAAFVIASFSFWMILFNQDFQDNILAEQNIPAAMKTLPVNGIPGNDNPGMLLADLTTVSLQYAYFPASLTVAATVDREMLKQPRSFTDPVSSYLEYASPCFGVQDREIQSGINIHNADLNMLTDLLDNKSYSPNVTLSAHFAPQYNYRAFADKSGSDYKSIPFGALESRIYTFRTGLSINMAWSPSWSIETGLHINKMGQYIEGISAYQHPEHRSLYTQNQFVITSLGGIRIHDTSRHFEDVASYRVVDTKESLDPKIMEGLMKSGEGLTQVFQFVEIPLVFRYKIAGQNLGIHLKGGVAGSYLLNKDVFMGSDIKGSPIGESYGIKQFNFSVMGGFAMQVPLTGRLNLQIEPTAQLFLQPFVLDGLRMGSVLPYNFSLHTGLSYRF